MDYTRVYIHAVVGRRGEKDTLLGIFFFEDVTEEDGQGEGRTVWAK